MAICTGQALGYFTQVLKFMGWNMHLAHMTIQQVESLRLSLINVQDSGSLCNCLLPEALKITAVQHDPVPQTKDASPSTPNSPTNGWWLTVDRDELGLLPPLSALLPEAPAPLAPNESFLISSSASKSFPFSLNTCN
ncbi:hypothetical protein C4D60_Mb07t01580 [Musa balbisiana]|uniref:Uncharacterized protein n=1 Tax=Musa balbisiana TaxID=52838 RepID=A0A4S8JCE2_MUSBA|nr:hypothetical protein C4D60_Mb07t01580 [Musa balbisiana]